MKGPVAILVFQTRQGDRYRARLDAGPHGSQVVVIGRDASNPLAAVAEAFTALARTEETP